MEYFFSGLIFLLCIDVVRKMLVRKNSLWLMVGIISIFSIGYYVLPVFFREESFLNRINHYYMNMALFISLLFLGSLFFAVEFSEKYFFSKKIKAIYYSRLDSIYYRNRVGFFFTSFVLWLLYYATTDLTSYSAEDFESYFTERSWYSGLLASLSNIALSIMVVTIAIALKKKEKLTTVFIVCYLICILLLLVGGQRLMLISPIFMFICSLSIFGNFRLAIKSIFVGVFILVLVSPIMVFFREFQGDRGKFKAVEASKEVKMGDNVVSTSIKSIMNRADLLYVSGKLIERYEYKNDFNHWIYLKSVFASYIPKKIYIDKPYALSDNGKMSGEISVQAWLILVGNSTGSLSAFGPITAYREGGLVWVIINGFFTGFSFVYINFKLSRGGYVSRILYVSIFILLTIKNVPISFFYLIVVLMPLVYYLVILKFLNKLLNIRF